MGRVVQVCSEDLQKPRKSNSLPYKAKQVQVYMLTSLNRANFNLSTGMWDIALCVCMFRRFMAGVVRVSCALPGVVLF